MRAQVYPDNANLEGLLNPIRGTDPARTASFKPTWETFNNTREQDIMPAIMLGNHREAGKLVVGVQSQRRREPKAVLGCE